MKNYRENNSCLTCKHLFVKMDYDEGVTGYYCNINKNKPRCGSIQLDEQFISEIEIRQHNDNWYCSEEKITLEKERREKWKQWAEKHCVSTSGICDLYKKE